jgi:recombinational DNA repair protein RecR
MYTPQFSDFATVSVRRLAWALESNMPAAVNRMVRILPTVFDAELVCQRCRDKEKCSLCVFSKQISESDRQTLSAM